MKDTSPKTVILLHESVKRSLLTDASTFVMIVSVIGIGWWLGSSAMQWAGFIMICIAMVGRASRLENKLTPQEAADLLHKRFGVCAEIIERNPNA